MPPQIQHGVAALPFLAHSCPGPEVVCLFLCLGHPASSLLVVPPLGKPGPAGQ